MAILRRLTLETDPRTGKRDYGYRRLFEVVQRVRVLRNLTFTAEVFVDLWEIALRPGRKLGDLVGIFSIVDVVPVGRLQQRGPQLAVVRAKLHGYLKRFYFGYGVHIDHPIDFEQDRLRITIFGRPEALRRATSYLQRSGIRSSVVGASPHLFAGEGWEGILTRRQREVLTLAHGLGYYDVPRRVDARGLGKRLGITHQSVVECLRRAERRLVGAIIEGRRSTGRLPSGRRIPSYVDLE